MRPTGKLHLGHLVGALENWVDLQSEYENYHLIADYHALTTNLDSSHIYDNSIDMLIDWLAAGIDPKASPMFRQSQIKEHTELQLIFSMLVTTARLERNPTLKEQVRDLEMENISIGHLGYPVLQAADILLYKGEVVPVGEDQLPHIEITREIARKFNMQYSPTKPTFPEPEGKITRFARLPGLDGKRMSKSVGNTILLADSSEVIQKKIRTAMTDPQKVRKGDPGRPEICLIYTYHQKFTPLETDVIERDCKSGKLGCVDCKMNVAKKVNDYLNPFRDKRIYYESHPEEVKEILHDGEIRAKEIAVKTMTEVHEVMKLG
jgi:tryptophanyl-tRNA synthetase